MTCTHSDPFTDPAQRLCEAAATHRVAGAGDFCQHHAMRYADRWTTLSGLIFIVERIPNG